MYTMNAFVENVFRVPSANAPMQALTDDTMSVVLMPEVEKLDASLITHSSEEVYAQYYGEDEANYNNRNEELEHLLTTSMGPFNEVEFSADIIFREEPIVDMTDPALMGTLSQNIRQYYQRAIKVRNDTSLSSVSVPKMKAVLRIDSDDTVTAKLKAVRVKCGLNTLKFNLTASVEVPFPNFDVVFNQVPKPPKTLVIYYWKIAVQAYGKVYTFRVAFRKESDKKLFSCNIECEDHICPELFVIVYHMLALYYKQQFLLFDRQIKSLRPDFPIDSLDGLTDFQKELARTCTLSKHEDEETVKPTDAISELTKCLCVRAYLKYSSEANIRCAFEPSPYLQKKSSKEDFKLSGLSIRDDSLVYSELSTKEQDVDICKELKQM